MPDSKRYDDDQAEPPVRAFGTWDAPITDEAVWMSEVPSDLTCMTCGEHFLADDNGVILPTGFAQHRECSYRSVMGGIGHHVDHARYCRSDAGPDAGLTVRQSALLVWTFNIDRMPVEVDGVTYAR